MGGHRPGGFAVREGDRVPKGRLCPGLGSAALCCRAEDRPLDDTTSRGPGGGHRDGHIPEQLLAEVGRPGPLPAGGLTLRPGHRVCRDPHLPAALFARPRRGRCVPRVADVVTDFAGYGIGEVAAAEPVRRLSDEVHRLVLDLGQHLDDLFVVGGRDQPGVVA